MQIHLPIYEDHITQQIILVFNQYSHAIYSNSIALYIYLLNIKQIIRISGTDLLRERYISSQQGIQMEMIQKSRNLAIPNLH
jgi:hypothetical protein